MNKANQPSWYKYRNIWIPIVGIPVGLLAGYQLVVILSELVNHYCINPLAAFLGLNAIGLLCIYFAIVCLDLSKSYERAITTPSEVIKPPIKVNTIAQNKLPSRNLRTDIPSSAPKPPYPNQAHNIIAIPIGKRITPRSFKPAVANIVKFLLRILHRGEID